MGNRKTLLSPPLHVILLVTSLAPYLLTEFSVPDKSTSCTILLVAIDGFSLVVPIVDDDDVLGEPNCTWLFHHWKLAKVLLQLQTYIQPQ